MHFVNCSTGSNKKMKVSQLKSRESFVGLRRADTPPG